MTEIEGRAFDVENNLPIMNSRMIFINTATKEKFEIPTDARGMFSITIPEGKYDIKLLSQEYMPIPLKNVDVKGDSQEIVLRSAKAILSVK